MALGEGRYFLGYLVAKSYPILQILTLFQFKIYHFFTLYWDSASPPTFTLVKFSSFSNPDF